MKMLLVDDHVLFREGMHHVLCQLDRQVDILDAGNFSEALSMAGNNPDIDLALLDLKMPDSDGVASVNLFHSRQPAIPIVVLSGTERRSDIEGAMNSGAMGFISKAATSGDMVQALRMVLGGGVYLPPQLLQQVAAGMDESGGGRRHRRANEVCLTTRQVEVIKHLARNLSNKEIALAIGLSEGTVKVHIAAIFQALRVNNRTEAAHAARRMGLIASEGRL